MLTVREAMKTGGLSKCRLLAGEAGLDNAITCVDCMEVPNIEPWLRSGELLITTATPCGTMKMPSPTCWRP